MQFGLNWAGWCSLLMINKFCQCTYCYYWPCANILQYTYIPIYISHVQMDLKKLWYKTFTQNFSYILHSSILLVLDIRNIWINEENIHTKLLKYFTHLLKLHFSFFFLSLLKLTIRRKRDEEATLAHVNEAKRNGWSKSKMDFPAKMKEIKQGMVDNRVS